MDTNYCALVCVGDDAEYGKLTDCRVFRPCGNSYKRTSPVESLFLSFLCQTHYHYFQIFQQSYYTIYPQEETCLQKRHHPQVQHACYLWLPDLHLLQLRQ